MAAWRVAVGLASSTSFILGGRVDAAEDKVPRSEVECLSIVITTNLLRTWVTWETRDKSA